MTKMATHQRKTSGTQNKSSTPKKVEKEVVTLPRPFSKWRTEPFDRAEDAAYAFGYHLIAKCRDEALLSLPAGEKVTRADVEKAVDVALHNVLDMVEGFWPLEVGPNEALLMNRSGGGRRRDIRHEIAGYCAP